MIGSLFFYCSLHAEITAYGFETTAEKLHNDIFIFGWAIPSRTTLALQKCRNNVISENLVIHCETVASLPPENVWADYRGQALANVKLSMPWWMIRWYCLRQQTANRSHVLHGYQFQTFKQEKCNWTIFVSQYWSQWLVHNKHSKCGASALERPADLARLYILSVLLNKAYSWSPPPPSAV